MREWVRLADRQLGVLAEERARLDGTIGELQGLRDAVARDIG
jgi:hypothetical protein